jgi:predicted enzyme related to lactoylglutathione lyase
MIDYHGRFVWYELMTTDTTAAGDFYARVVGWGTHDASTPSLHYTFFTARKAPVSGLVQLPEEARASGAAPRWIGYVGVDDVDATADRIRRLGGAVHIPPTDTPNISRFSLVADPQAAALALIKWLQPGAQQAPEPGKPGRVSWHELLAADWAKAFAFYGEIFGWQNADAGVGPMGTYQLFSAAGETIGGMFTKPTAVPAPLWLYYFNVGDIDAAAARVKADGGRVLDGPLEMPGSKWVARCADPQGAAFGLEGKRSNAIGYFERAPRVPGGA